MRKILILAVIVGMIGCTRNTTTLFLTGTINPWDNIDILLLSSPMVSSVSGTVNGNPLTVDFDGWEVRLTSDIPISPGATYSIDITTDRGTGSASITVPGVFDVTYPSGDTTFPINTDVSLQWSASINAQWYKVRIHHSSNIPDTTYILGDTTNFIIPGTMFSQQNDRITINVYAENGPPQIPGGKGNMTGDIKGFINAEYDDATVHFWIR